MEDFGSSNKNQGAEPQTRTLRVQRRGFWQRLVERRSTFWVGVLFVGPLALPLLWRDPKYSRPWKVVITIGVGVLTYFLVLDMISQADHAKDIFVKIQEQLEEQERLNQQEERMERGYSPSVPSGPSPTPAP